MLLTKPSSHRAPTAPTGPARELLDTCYQGKTLRFWVTHKPGTTPDSAELGSSEQVHVAILANHHQITKNIGEILNKALSGDAVVVVCHTPKAYQAALTFLGYQRPAKDEALLK